MDKFEQINKWAKSTMELMQNNFDHNFGYIKDVSAFANQIVDLIKKSNPDVYINKEILNLCVNIHDVGRIVQSHNHEEIGGDIIYNILKYNGFDEKICAECKQIVSEHAWTTKPTTIEAKILKDADKLGYIGINRWKDCDEHNFLSNGLISRLNILRDNLILQESKIVFDEEFPKFKEFLKQSKNFKYILEQLND